MEKGRRAKKEITIGQQSKHEMGTTLASEGESSAPPDLSITGIRSGQRNCC